MAAAIIAAIILYAADYRWLVLLLVFFIVGTAFTRYRIKDKMELGVAERRGGVRGIENVFANGFVPSLIVLLATIYPSRMVVFTSAYIGALATATADTLASEIGVLSPRDPVLILNPFQKVRVGEDGGVSFLGELAALLGTLIIGFVAWLLQLASFETCVLASIVGGMFGCNLDSLLGATLQRKGLIDNNSTNLLSCFGGALMAYAIAG